MFLFSSNKHKNDVWKILNNLSKENCIKVLNKNLILFLKSSNKKNVSKLMYV